MKALTVQPNLVEQVCDAIVEEIASGQLPAGERVIQEQIAQALGVSRQPVQQALLLLRNQGVLRDAPGRGLIVAPLDADHVRHIYDLRAVIEGLACRHVAELRSAQVAQAGEALIEAGREAVSSGSVARMIACDMRFHAFIHEQSGNPLIAQSLATHLMHTQRVMGEVLMRDEKPRDVWDEHAGILQAIVAGDADLAETLARRHVLKASGFMVMSLRGARARHA